jgi:hypothetical protein
LASQRWKGGGALAFNLAPQAVVIQRVDLFTRGRADVTFSRTFVFGADAFFDLGQDVHQLPAFFFALGQRRVLRHARHHRRWHLGELFFNLRQQLHLLRLHRRDLALYVFGRVA